MSVDTLAETAAALERRALSPVELVGQFLARAEALNPTLHAFLRLDPEGAMRAALEAEQRMVRGARLGPLDGLPIAHKDTFDTAGVETSSNSARFSGRVPARDADVVRNLARAGAVSLGKTACYESAFAGPSDDLPAPAPRNPWGLDRSTAGSSSGSAVAVAAGLAMATTGSDTGGSLRDPAGLCGVVGLKPTHGLCSTAGLFPFAGSLDTAGPMAMTALDCALMLDAMAPLSASSYAAAAHRPVRGLRVGVVPRFREDSPVSPEVERVLALAEAALRDAGATLSVVELPPLADYQACGWPLAMAELYEVHLDTLQADGGRGYGRLLRIGLAVGAAIPAASYISALRRRAELTALTRIATEDVDVLLLPAQDAEAAPLSEIKGDLPFQKPTYTMPFDVTGQPAIVICAGEGEGGLPIGVQLVAHHAREDLLFRAACGLERGLGRGVRRPALAG